MSPPSLRSTAKTPALFALAFVLGCLQAPSSALAKEVDRKSAYSAKPAPQVQPSKPTIEAKKAPAQKLRTYAKAGAVGVGAGTFALAASRPSPLKNGLTGAAKREGEGEARLIEIYQLIGSGQTSHALTKAEALVNSHPNFQLAQLVYGDLLSFRTRPVRMPGDVPDATARLAAPNLADLREETAMRLKALRERPAPGMIPAPFLQLSSRNKYALAVDASRSRLYMFEHKPTGLSLVADFYISVGKAGMGKEAEGDLRTPMGVYYITNSIAPKLLKDFYGSGALPINYPNPLDLRRGKTGSGIWLHGTPPSQFARPPKASDGCVVLANPDLEFILSRVEIRDTPVLIAPSITWVAPQSIKPEASEFDLAIQGWRKAKSGGDLSGTMKFYSNDFNNDGKDLSAWAPVIRKDIDSAPGRKIELKDLSYLRWNDGNADTMVVTFDEIIEGNARGPKKRQYWSRQGSQWKIFFEGTIG
jgi:L,D-transpeptidase YnhG